MRVKLRAQILDLLACRGSNRKSSFWYRPRSRRERHYADRFDEPAAKNDNFQWHVALSEPDEATSRRVTW